MTLNQILTRLRTIAEAHQQVRSYRQGLVGDLFADHTAKYIAVCLQYVNGNLNTLQHFFSVNFRMFVVDLVNVSSGTKDNEDEVLSDTLSVLLDLVAQFNRPEYSDWKMSASNSAQVIIEGENDLHSGWYIDFSISAKFSQNTCAVPTTLEDLVTDTNVNTLVYDDTYTATGSETRTIVIPGLIDKKLLFLSRENTPLYKVTNLPDSLEFTFDDTTGTIVTGTDIGADERFHYLFRNKG